MKTTGRPLPLALLPALCLLLAGLAACTSPKERLQAIAVQNSPAGPEPAPAAEFFADAPDSIYPVVLCRLDEEYCYHISAEGAPDFFARLGPISSSQPVVRKLDGEVRGGIHSVDAVYNRWLSCFISTRDGKLYSYYSKNNLITGPRGRSLGVMFVVKPDNDKYQEVKEKCGPFSTEVQAV